MNSNPHSFFANNRNLVLFISLIILSFPAYNQEVVTNLRGIVTDSETKGFLTGAQIFLIRDSATIGGGTADENGEYRIRNIPVGRYKVAIIHPGYSSRSIPNVIMDSGKETILDVELSEAVQELEEVLITVGGRGDAINDMTTVSARRFSVDEAGRYAGSRGDPARMAANFAGVQGTDDTRNDLVIRGNSPLGVVYRLQGINIPNPNHFAVTGSAGGPIGMLNNKVLANSDFMTGAFPAEFGNGTAGAFDIALRNGNYNSPEMTIQAGNFGAELTGEGSFTKTGRASYLFNARYATLEFFQAVGIDIGTTAIPKYADMAFKLNFPTAAGNNFSVWGLGGFSMIDFIVSDQKTAAEAREIFATGFRDSYFRSGMGVAGMSYLHIIGENTYLKFSAAISREYTHGEEYDVWRHTEGADSHFVVDSITTWFGYNNNTYKNSSNITVNHKINSRHSLRTGIITDVYDINLIDSIASDTFGFRRRYDIVGRHVLMQPFFQWKYNAGEKVTINSGIHGQYFSLNNNSLALEPRVGMSWRFAKSQALNLGTGMHSGMQPLYQYFLQQIQPNGSYIRPSTGMGFSKSIHLIAGYDRAFGENVRIRLESYYQYLYSIPTDTATASFSLLNQGSGFNRFFPGKLVNQGTGRNTGIEFTLEKFFSRKWFMLFTSSLFDSRYEGNNGRIYNTDFNSNYIFNLLGTREFAWGNKQKSSLGIGGKLTYAGGKRYSPIDTAASLAALDEIYSDTEKNTFQFKPYFRFDLKINYKLNARKFTHDIGLDLVNLTGYQNLLTFKYTGRQPDFFDPVYQLGFLPVFYYRMDFAWKKE